MAANDTKVGPLSLSDLLALWQTVVDKGYSDPIVTAGEGNGLEVYTQAFEQLARVSRAIDTTTQAMFIRAWSGQSSPPASRGVRATVDLSLSRNSGTEKPLQITNGIVYFEEQTTDWGVNGGVTVQTGRRYTLTADAFLFPGDVSLQNVSVAERVGYGYNNPKIGTITHIQQPGAGYANTGGSITCRFAYTSVISVADTTAHDIRVGCRNVPEVLIPEHVGQYIQITASSVAANVGLISRITSYYPPGATTVGDGGSVRVEPLYLRALNLGADLLTAGDIIELRDGGAVVLGVGRVIAQSFILGGAQQFAFVLMSGTIVGTVEVFIRRTLTAWPYNATYPSYSSDMQTDVAGGTAWRILDWALDGGLSVTNEAQPSGGLSAMLDELGAERNLPRASAESDAAYRERIATPADVVSPNALHRAANRVLVPIGISHCLREVGDASHFPGLFFDAGGSAAGDGAHAPDPAPDPTRNFAYDFDFTVRPTDRYKLNLDWSEFRAFFVVSVPTRSDGDFGCPYDGTTADAFPVLNAYDRAEPAAACAFDGFPNTASQFWRRLYASLNDTKAGGVGFDLVRDDGACP